MPVLMMEQDAVQKERIPEKQRTETACAGETMRWEQRILQKLAAIMAQEQLITPRERAALEAQIEKEAGLL